MLAGHVGEDQCCWRGAATSSSPSARPARTTAVRSPKGCGRRHGALPVAPRLLQPAHRRGAARAGARRRSRCWRVEQRDGKVVVREKLPASPASRPRPRRCAAIGSSSSAAAPPASPRPRCCAARATTGRITMLERRRGRAGRSPEPVEGLPRRHRARGVDAAARRDDFYAEQNIELRARRARRGDRPACARGACSPTAAALALRRAAARHRRRAGPAADPRRATCRTSTRCARSPTAARSSPRAAAAQARGRDRRELHRPRGRRVAARARPRGARRRAGSAPDGDACSAASSGDFVRALHEEHGVAFHLGDTAARSTRSASTLNDGSVARRRPRRRRRRRAAAARSSPSRRASRSIAASSSTSTCETSVPGIFAAGDIARWPDAHSGERIRVEHWVVAERQGQTAARNMLGAARAFDAVPFFWSQHYDVPINYVGHAEGWDELDDRRRYRGARLRGALQARRPRAAGRVDLSRRRKLERRGGDGARRRAGVAFLPGLATCGRAGCRAACAMRERPLAAAVRPL